MLCDDPVCSFEVDIVKECLGREYEQLLINLLRQRDMCFETESDQRSRGAPSILIKVYGNSESESVCREAEDPGYSLPNPHGDRQQSVRSYCCYFCNGWWW